MAAERTLKVSFDEPEHGWIAITMIADDKQFMLVPSHVPYDSITELATALNKILEGYSEAAVRWNEEPAEYEFVFRGNEEVINLDVYEVTTVQGGIRRISVFNFVGPRDQSLIAFWRALRELQGRYDPSEYERRWKEPFPTREMEALTQRMNALKHG
ncbi:MAG TPA: hypothetical protein VIC84_25705 [Blastocatellia bacterium]|jgi:hypothetical protein